MDTIQRVLIKAGRKDLAQKYYKRIAKIDHFTHQQLINAISYLQKATPKDYKEAMRTSGEGMDEPEKMKFIDFYFGTDGLYAHYKAVFENEKKSWINKSDSMEEKPYYATSIFISWNGKNFYGSYSGQPDFIDEDEIDRALRG